MKADPAITSRERPAPAVGGLSDPDALTVAELVAMFLRHWVLILSCMVLVSLAGAGLYKMQRPVHSSTARVLVQTDQLGTPSFLSGIAAYRESQYAEPVNRKIETEIALILSRSNATQVIESMHIDSDDLPASPLKLVSRDVAAFFKRLIGKSEPPEGPGPSAELIDDFLGTISIEAARSKTAETTSNVLEIKLDSARIDYAPAALGRMLQAYLEVGAQQGQRLGQATIGRLTAQVADAQSDLARIEKAILDLSIQESGRIDLAATATSAASVQSGGKREASGSATEAAVTQLVTQMLQLQGQLAELRETYTDDTENVRKLKQRVGDARARLASHMRASASSSAEFTRLERQRTLAQDHYGELRKKLDQIDLYMQLTPAALNGRVVVDAPSTPQEAERKKKKTMLLLAPAAGLLLGLFLASAVEFFRQRLRTRREVERFLGLPLLGSLPTMPAEAVHEAEASTLRQAGPAPA